MLVARGFPPRVGGVETLCGQLADGLSRRGDEVTVVTFGGHIARPQTTVEQGLYRVVRLPSRGGTFEHSAHLRATLRGCRFDICHVHNLHTIVAAAVWRAGCRPYVLTGHYHGGGHTAPARLVHPLYRTVAARVVRAAAAVTAVSATEASLIRDHFGVDPLIIPNGIEPPTSAARVPVSARTIVVISRLVAYKRVDAVIHALTHLSDHDLHIIGDGPQRTALLRLAAELGVTGRVRLTHERLSDAQVHAAVAGAAVHVNLSQAEAFSYTVLESLAAGTPTVVNAGSALSEWVVRFPAAVAGADPDDPVAVAATVRRMAMRRVAVDLGEYRLANILDRYQDTYTRAAA
jgi:glycosyltransferase involved in cell wall biosynthesis